MNDKNRVLWYIHSIIGDGRILSIDSGYCKFLLLDNHSSFYNYCLNLHLTLYVDSIDRDLFIFLESLLLTDDKDNDIIALYIINDMK